MLKHCPTEPYIPRKLSMPLKRSHSSSSPSDGGVLSNQGPSKRAPASAVPDTREGSVEQYPLRIYIISAKLLPDTLQNLVSLVEKHTAHHGNTAGAQHFELAADLDHADVIVTAVHTRPRLERHVSWGVAVREPSHLLHTGLMGPRRKLKPSSLLIG